MDVIHFTRNATDPVTSCWADGARFVPLADGSGDTHVSCLHLEEGARIDEPATRHATSLLVVHGGITVSTQAPAAKINIQAGMGAVFERRERYAIQSDRGAIVLIVEAHELIAQARGICEPQRIAGAQWPSDLVLIP